MLTLRWVRKEMIRTAARQHSNWTQIVKKKGASDLKKNMERNKLSSAIIKAVKCIYLMICLL